MDIAELRDVQSRERTTDSLQELPDSFYSDVASYIAELKAERERTAEAADDPFSDPDVNRLSDEIQTAEQVSESLYERRVGKIVKQASFAAAGMGGAEDGLTAEEQDLYDDLVERIEDNKARVLDVLAGQGDTDDSDGSDADANVDPDTGVDASALMGDGADLSSETPAPPAADTASPPDSAPTADVADGERSETRTDVSDAPETHAEEDEGTERPAPPDESDDERPDDERATVQITRDVGEIFGVDERTYTLESEDVVSLPEANAEPLVEKDAATRLD